MSIIKPMNIKLKLNFESSLWEFFFISCSKIIKIDLVQNGFIVNFTVFF